MAPKSKKPPKPKGPSLDQRIRTDAKLRARVLKNPGLRSKLSDATLAKYAPAQAKSRALTKRLATPIAPGSAITERDLAHEAQAAQTVKYGPLESDFAQQIGRSQQVERDTGTFYDQYLQLQAQHAAAVQAFQQGAQQALAQTAAGVTGLAGTQAQALQQQANQQAATQGVAPAGDLTGLASQAAATRQTLMGTFQGEQALTGAAANTYASGQVPIAGAQKLSALAQARGRTGDLQKRQTDLRREEGAFNQQFRQERRGEEFKNQLALGALNLQGAKAQADAAASTPEAVAATTSARQSASTEASTAQKYGYSVHQWRMLGPKGRANIIAKSKKTSTNANNVITSGPLAGKTKTWVEAHPTEAGKLVQDYERRHGTKGAKPKPGEPGAGPEWKNPNDQSKARSQVVSLRDYANKAKAGQPFVAGHSRQPRASRAQAAAKLKQAVAAPADPILLTAALDAAYDGRLSRATVRKLIAAGYKPGQIASALGVGTGPTPRGSSTTRPGSGPNRARP